MLGGSTKGDTLFCSMTKAYEMLSPDLQQQLDGMTVQHAVHDLMKQHESDQVDYPNGLGVL